VTLHPAMLLGVESRIGSIQVGRDADLVFLSGDPVDPLTEVRRVMVLGRIVWEETP
jgi:imidazolonepropionase-like amidohydrolase